MLAEEREQPLHFLGGRERSIHETIPAGRPALERTSIEAQATEQH
jgi:hypothetical protein